VGLIDFSALGHMYILLPLFSGGLACKDPGSRQWGDACSIVGNLGVFAHRMKHLVLILNFCDVAPLPDTCLACICSSFTQALCQNSLLHLANASAWLLQLPFVAVPHVRALRRLVLVASAVGHC